MSNQTHHLATLVQSRLGPWLEPGRLARLSAVAVLLTLICLASLRAPIGKVWGDEGTFLAMMQSLVEDGDLRFDERDASRAEVAEGGRGHLILQRAGNPASAGGGVAYSKPVLFPLLAAPFYAVAGEYGPVGFNVLVLVLALWLARGFLLRLAHRHGDPQGLADLALVGFVGASVLVPYTFWRMSDSLQCSLALIGLVLVFAARLPSLQASDLAGSRACRILAWRGAPWLGAVLLAALVSLRVSNGLLALVPVTLAVVDRKGRRAAGYLTLVVVAVLALQAMTARLTGAENPYRAVRATFTPDTGFPVGPDAAAVLPRFELNRASHITSLSHPAKVGQVLYSSLYAWLGRHTGILVYFPASILLLWSAIRRSDAAGKVAILAFLGTLAFYVGWKPGNYFGGETFLGNRYLLPAYPALLVALRRPPSVRAWLGVWLVAALVFGSAVVSAVRLHDLRTGIEADLSRGSQNHAYAGVFRWLPWESTSRSMEGTRDRYWSGQFVRFVDPFADVGRNSFELDARRPPAEMLVAHWCLADTLLLQVRSSAADATLTVAHGGREQRFEVGRDAADDLSTGAAASGWLRVVVQPRRPWRHHRFWFNDSAYWITPFRLGIESAEPGATAEIIFVGDPVSLARAYAYELLDDNWPERPLRLVLRNTSALAWEDDDAVPVTLRWRLLRPALDGHPEHRLAESRPIGLPRRVEPGDDVVLEVPVEWPIDAGSYALEVDLVMEQVAWFGDRVGSPVFRRSFEVSEPVPSPGPAVPPDRPRPD